MPVIICISDCGTDHKVKLLGYLGQVNLANFVSWLRKYLWLSNALCKYLKNGQMAKPHVLKLMGEKNYLTLLTVWILIRLSMTQNICSLHRLPVSFCTIDGCHHLKKWFIKNYFSSNLYNSACGSMYYLLPSIQVLYWAQMKKEYLLLLFNINRVEWNVKYMPCRKWPHPNTHFCQIKEGHWIPFESVKIQKN